MTKDDKVMFHSFDLVEKFKNDVIKPSFKEVKLASSQMMSIPGEIPLIFKGKLSLTNLFKDTQYEHNSEGDFIHFTSLFGLKTILESGFLRMSEFGNLIDKGELLYAAQVFENKSLFQFDIERINQLKENIFCLSACVSNENTRRNEFMWEVYGDNGKGVIIEFEFTKKNPSSLLIGNVQYGKDQFNILQDLLMRSEKFANENSGFFPNNFIEFFLPIQAFHKKEEYLKEEEIRIFRIEEKLPYEEHTLKSFYKDINVNQEVRYFNKLYLKNRHPYYCEGNDESVLDHLPQIEIKNIILGFNISVKNKVDLNRLLSKIKLVHNYDFKISQLETDGNIREMC